MIIDMSALSVVGLVRQVNQDSIFAMTKGNTGVFLVADGMGGHFRGEIGSQKAAGMISDWWQATYDFVDTLSFYEVVESLEKKIRDINNDVEETYRVMGEMGGTTFCLLFIQNNSVALFNIGDSRAFASEKGKLKQLSSDDVWENLPEVRAYAESNDITQDVRYGTLVKAVGIYRGISPTITTKAVEKKTVFFICSDGVYKYIDEARLAKLLKKVGKVGDAEKINEIIRTEVYANGAPDNTSMITILVQ